MIGEKGNSMLDLIRMYWRELQLKQENRRLKEIIEELRNCDHCGNEKCITSKYAEDCFCSGNHRRSLFQPIIRQDYIQLIERMK